MRSSLAVLAVVAVLAVCGAADADPGHSGPRKTIAVGGFDAVETTGGATTADGLAAMLTAALLKDRRFVVVERQAMAQIQWEQQLGQSGVAAQGTTPAPGQMIGASVLVRGTVTKFDPHASGGSFGIGGPGLFGGTAGALGVSNERAVVEINLRLIDTATGRIIDSSTASGSASAGGFDIRTYSHSGMSIGGSAFTESPLGKACQDAVNRAVERIGSGMEHVAWSALVVENTGDQLFIDAGADQNMQPGMTLHVIRKIRDLTDPATGAVLETLTEPVGDIQLREIHDKVSTAVVTSGSQPSRGDIVHAD